MTAQAGVNCPIPWKSWLQLSSCDAGSCPRPCCGCADQLMCVFYSGAFVEHLLCARPRENLGHGLLLGPREHKPTGTGAGLGAGTPPACPLAPHLSAGCFFTTGFRWLLHAAGPSTWSFWEPALGPGGGQRRDILGGSGESLWERLGPTIFLQPFRPQAPQQPGPQEGALLGGGHRPAAWPPGCVPGGLTPPLWASPSSLPNRYVQ